MTATENNNNNTTTAAATDNATDVAVIKSQAKRTYDAMESDCGTNGSNVQEQQRQDDQDPTNKKARTTEEPATGTQECAAAAAGATAVSGNEVGDDAVAVSSDAGEQAEETSTETAAQAGEAVAVVTMEEASPSGEQVAHANGEESAAANADTEPAINADASESNDEIAIQPLQLDVVEGEITENNFFYDNRDITARFYQHLFHWTVDTPADGTATLLSFQDGKHRFAAKQQNSEETTPKVVIQLPYGTKIEELTSKVVELGGEAKTEEIVSVEQVARSLVILDPNGNTITLHEPSTFVTTTTAVVAAVTTTSADDTSAPEPTEQQQQQE